ncbi:hypothetical protein D3C80_2130980 [compost metagenome]
MLEIGTIAPGAPFAERNEPQCRGVDPRTQPDAGKDVRPGAREVKGWWRAGGRVARTPPHAA